MLQDRAILLAIAVAENEGWPAITGELVQPSSPLQRISERGGFEFAVR